MRRAGPALGYKTGVLALLILATVVNSFDRASLSVAAPFIIREFGITKAAMGLALSAFFWTYMIGNVAGGRLADRLGGKAVLGGAFTIWSVFSAATGLAQNVGQLVLARLGVGFGEGPSFPTTTKIIAGVFPLTERGAAIGGNAAGARIGLAVCPILMALLITTLGWRTAFYITGFGSLLWVAAWILLFKPRASIDEAPDAPAPQAVKIPWLRILSSRAILSLIVVKFTQDFLQWMFLTWIPGYLITGRHFSVVQMGVYTSLAFGVGAAAQPVVGFLSDALIRHGWSVNRARKTVQAALQLLSATIIVTGFSGNPSLAMVFMVVAIAAESTCAGHIWTIIADVIPSRYVGSVSGVINALGAIAGVISPILTGWIVDVTGHFALALGLGGGIILLSSAVLLLAVPSLNAPWTYIFDERRLRRVEA